MQDLYDLYLSLLKKEGEFGLCEYVVKGIQCRKVNMKDPEVEILNLSINFFNLYRETGKKDYFIAGKSLRRAAHKIYRINKGKVDDRFIQSIGRE